ncbi:MAG: alpha/beta fold hydrolase [Burkholderiales bacterium]
MPDHGKLQRSGLLALAGLLTAVLILIGSTRTHAARNELANLAAGVGTLATEEIKIDSDTPGIQLYVRNKRPLGLVPTADNTVLFVHGATYPAETSFDLRLDGISWMEFIALQGWNVYLVDLRGYGRSTRPPQMFHPPGENDPIVTTDVAIRDVSAAVDFIRWRDGIKKINLIGWSWGTAIMGGYTERNNDKVMRLVLYGVLWVRETPSSIKAPDKLGAYRLVAREDAKKRWLRDVPADKVATLLPDNWFDAWADATWQTDPESKESGLLRAPNGVIHDVRAYWMQGKTTWNPTNIRVPTLVIGGEWDRDTPPYMSRKVFDRLTSAPARRRVEIGEGTHTVIMEKNRLQLFREVQLFLEE